MEGLRAEDVAKGEGDHGQGVDGHFFGVSGDVAGWGVS